MECATPRVILDGNYGPWVTMTCQGRSLGVSTGPTLQGGADNRKSLRLCGGARRKSLPLLLSFAVN